jgi:hypothetical protein
MMFPTAEEILDQLTTLANLGRGLAVLWHVVVLLALGALWTERWRPSRRLAAIFSALPVASAAVMAAASGNPFNGLVLGVAAVALVLLGARLSSLPVERGSIWTAGLGAGAVAYALVYPHFVSTTWLLAFWTAPVGVIPCPSLALVLGLGLLGNGFGSRAWALVAAVAGVFYALFGMFRLGVWLDAGLLVAAVAMMVQGLAPHGHSHGTPGTPHLAT